MYYHLHVVFMGETIVRNQVFPSSSDNPVVQFPSITRIFPKLLVHDLYRCDYNFRLWNDSTTENSPGLWNAIQDCQPYYRSTWNFSVATVVIASCVVLLTACKCDYFYLLFYIYVELQCCTSFKLLFFINLNVNIIKVRLEIQIYSI